MSKENQQRLNLIRLILDVITIAVSYFIAYFLFFYLIPSSSIFGGKFSGIVNGSAYRLAVIYIVPVHVLWYGFFKLYRYLRFTGRRKEAGSIMMANLVSIMTIIVGFFLFKKEYSTHFSRMFLVDFGIVNTVSMVAQRNLLRLIIRSATMRGDRKKKILIVGYSEGAQALIERLIINPTWGYEIRGILDDEAEKGTEYKGIQVIGHIGRLPKILAQNEVEEVFVTLQLSEYSKLKHIVTECEKAGIMTRFIPDYGSFMSNRPYTEDIMGLPVINVRQVPLNDIINAFMKRTMDIIGALVAIILFSPIMLVTAILVKTGSKGPLIFKQERVGLHNKPFKMYKFRSMRVQTEEEEKKNWTVKNDPRVTWIGRIIRKTSIDEMPQFFNVLFGDMSLVGPRPERPQFVEKFREEIPRYMVKHQVRPGITGWAQVNGYRGDTSIRGRIDHDIYYIENWTLGLDIKILFLTFFKGFVNKNAY